MRVIAFAGCPHPKVKVNRERVLGRVASNLRSLKVSHSQLRIQIGMLREAVTGNTRTLANLRADVHDLEKEARKRNG